MNYCQFSTRLAHAFTKQPYRRVIGRIRLVESGFRSYLFMIFFSLHSFLDNRFVQVKKSKKHSATNNASKNNNNNNNNNGHLSNNTAEYANWLTQMIVFTLLFSFQIWCSKTDRSLVTLTFEKQWKPFDRTCVRVYVEIFSEINWPKSICTGANLPKLYLLKS